ncbi:hypothetical protein [Azospirillum largimobile]
MAFHGGGSCDCMVAGARSPPLPSGRAAAPFFPFSTADCDRRSRPGPVAVAVRSGYPDRPECRACAEYRSIGARRGYSRMRARPRPPVRGKKGRLMSLVRRPVCFVTPAMS